VKTRYQGASSFHWDLAGTGGQKGCIQEVGSLVVNGMEPTYRLAIVVVESFSLVHPDCWLCAALILIS
ncbi:hypothetical protein QBC32DRAFT_211533, partial [Pseudoneurospora amorphoporcata]